MSIIIDDEITSGIREIYSENNLQGIFSFLDEEGFIICSTSGLNNNELKEYIEEFSRLITGLASEKRFFPPSLSELIKDNDKCTVRSIRTAALVVKSNRSVNTLDVTKNNKEEQEKHNGRAKINDS